MYQCQHSKPQNCSKPNVWSQFLCLISVHMHFGTLSSSLCWMFTVTRTRAFTIMALLITGHFVCLSQHSELPLPQEIRNIISNLQHGERLDLPSPLPSWAWWAFSPTTALFLWPPEKDNYVCLMRGFCLLHVTHATAASLTNLISKRNQLM